MGGKSESGLAKETARERPTYTPSFVILSSIDRSLARRSTRDGPCMRGAWPAHRQVILGYQSYHSHRHVSLALFSSRTSSSFRSSSPSLAANSMPHVTACMVHRLVYIYIYVASRSFSLFGCLAAVLSSSAIYSQLGSCQYHRLQNRTRRTNASNEPCMHRLYPCIQNLSSLSPFVENISKIMSTLNYVLASKSGRHACLIKLTRCEVKGKGKKFYLFFKTNGTRMSRARFY